MLREECSQDDEERREKVAELQLFPMPAVHNSRENLGNRFIKGH